MIWDLVKDSPEWRVAAWFSLFYAAGWLMLTQGDPNGVAAGAPMLVYMTHFGAVAMNPETGHRCTFFDAALPVPGRQLWISKMVVLLGGLWLPVLAASAVGFLVMKNPALPLLEAAAGVSAMYLFAQGFRMHEFHEPRWLCVTSMIVGGGLMTMINMIFLDSGAIVLGCYLALDVVLFAVNLARVPKSFQCVSAESPAADRAADRVEAGGPAEAASATGLMVWWPVLRSIDKWWALVILLGTVAFFPGGPMMGIVGFTMPLMAMTKQQWLYLSHLPISMRKIFCVSWTPMILAILVGTQLNLRFYFGHPTSAVMKEPRMMAILSAISLGLFLLWLLTMQSGEWRRLRRVPAALRACFLAVLPLASLVGWLLRGREVWHQYNDPLSYVAMHVATALPENPVLLALALLLPLAGLYWLAERTFCEMEYPAAMERTLGQSYFRGAE